MTDGTHIDSLTTPIQAGTSAAGAQAPTPDQLRLLAAQFESMLLTQMITQMRSSLFGDDEADAGFAKGPLADAMYGELSLALSRAGGFGLSESMLAPMLRQIQAEKGREATGGEEAGRLQAAALMPSSAISMPDVTGPAMRPALFSGSVSSAFGWRQHPVNGGTAFHKGVDIAMPVGRDVPVARAGQVTFSGEQGAYGLTVMVDHGNGVSTRYAHLSELLVKEGDAVSDGQTIARSGATGRVTGAHLHFEVLENGQPLDPAVSLGRVYAKR